eukprot:14001367-Alexandrium_andersonii.AAC.1
MSASLVGSEMCIRDRIFVVWLTTCWPAPVSATPEPCVCTATLRVELARGCLLYTSDAADDM